MLQLEPILHLPLGAVLRSSDLLQPRLKLELPRWWPMSSLKGVFEGVACGLGYAPREPILVFGFFFPSLGPTC
jgi:hypothetical protein